MIRETKMANRRPGVAILPVMLGVLGVVLAAVLVGGFLRGDVAGFWEFAWLAAGAGALVLMTMAVLTAFLRIGERLTDEADAREGPTAAAVAQAAHPETARARRRGAAVALDRWNNEGGGQ